MYRGVRLRRRPLRGPENTHAFLLHPVLVEIDQKKNRKIHQKIIIHHRA